MPNLVENPDAIIKLTHPQQLANSRSVGGREVHMFQLHEALFTHTASLRHEVAVAKIPEFHVKRGLGWGCTSPGGTY
jgi:hypothetical protein